jgi:hypothetical protein
MNWDRLARIAGGFAYIVNRPEFRETTNTYMRELQTRIFYAKGFPQSYAIKALEF